MPDHLMTLDCLQVLDNPGEMYLHALLLNKDETLRAISGARAPRACARWNYCSGRIFLFARSGI